MEKNEIAMSKSGQNHAALAQYYALK